MPESKSNKLSVLILITLELQPTRIVCEMFLYHCIQLPIWINNHCTYFWSWILSLCLISCLCELHLNWQSSQVCSWTFFLYSYSCLCKLDQKWHSSQLLSVHEHSLYVLLDVSASCICIDIHYKYFWSTMVSSVYSVFLFTVAHNPFVLITVVLSLIVFS